MTGVDLVSARLGPDASLVGAATLIHYDGVYARDGRVAATMVAR